MGAYPVVEAARFDMAELVSLVFTPCGRYISREGDIRDGIHPTAFHSACLGYMYHHRQLQGRAP